MQAIETKYLSPTNTKGSRIRATCAAKSIVFNWVYNLDPGENHIVAAKKLVKILDWKNVTIQSGCLKNGNYVHVLIDKRKL